MTGPLRRLAQAATDMQKGKLDAPIEVEGDDEVAQLAFALNQTARALAESMATLESRVQERVHELIEAHDREAALNRELIAHNEQLRSQGETLRAQGEELERQRTELVEKTRRSEEADRLKSAFIANMSHEIRTPLNSVLALSQLLRDGMAGALSNDQRRYLEVIERNGQNLLRLINDILDLSRIEAGHLEMDLQATDIGAQIRATVGTLVPLAEAKGLDLHARLPDDLPTVRCDVDRVRQILTNLIGNAIKFTETGQVQVSAEARGEQVAVHVTDTGVGIPDSAKAKVFEEFFQVDQSMARRQGGTGLGLAIASRLARLMGGEISFDSVVGSGSRFTLTLPRSVEARDQRRVEGAAEGEASLSGRLVMLLDEDADDRRQVGALLAEMGVHVETPASADKALAELRWESSRFSALLLDPTPAGSIGAEVAAAIEGDVRLARLPLIVLSSQDLTVRDREQLAHSAFGFARKGETLPIALGPMLRKALRAPGGHARSRAAAGARFVDPHRRGQRGQPVHAAADPGQSAGRSGDRLDGPRGDRVLPPPAARRDHHGHADARHVGPAGHGRDPRAAGWADDSDHRADGAGDEGRSGTDPGRRVRRVPAEADPAQGFARDDQAAPHPARRGGRRARGTAAGRGRRAWHAYSW